MRTNFIRDLNLKGAELLLLSVPNADSYNLREVTRLSWQLEDGDATLLLTMQYHDRDRDSSHVSIRCTGVRQLKLPALSPRFYLSEVEIEDVSARQLEKVRFRVKDYGGDFELDCWDVEIVDATVGEDRL